MFFTPVRFIFAIVLLEGFVTISAEILTIRQLIPFVGSSVVVTSLIIGIFLLFLAYGYRKGGQIQKEHAHVLMRNFIAAAFFLGIGLSYIFVYFWFYFWRTYLTPHDIYPLLSYLLVVTAPLVYWLGQTVPLTLHLFPGAENFKTGLLSGRILHINTLGSFLGAVLTSVLLFNFFGVAWTVLINAMVLILLSFLLFRQPSQLLSCVAASLLIFPFACMLNLMIEQEYFIKTNHYANYRLATYETPHYSAKQLEINNTPASFLDSQGKSFPYIESIKTILFKDLALQGKDILILGAGGFTISKGETQNNHFVYVDIDPDIKALSEQHFSGPIQGEFVAQDARSYLNTTQQRFDAIVVDAYNSPLVVPAHLVTHEYFTSLIQVLKPGGAVLLNFIANPRFKEAYARRVDNTLRSALGFCTNQPASHEDRLTNIIYVCYPEHREERGIYSDNLNSATLDAFMML